MKKKQFLLIVLIIILATALVLKIFRKDVSQTKPEKIIEPVATPVENKVDVIFSGVSSTTGEINIINPQPGELIVSPLLIQGQAKGNWFFEASLPIKLLDANKQIIALYYGTAQSDWMTDSLVPFTSTMSFTTTATSGYLVIAKDNPSGLPANEGSISIPVRFK